MQAESRKPLVKNAASKNQVKRAKEKEKFNQDDLIKDTALILNTSEGRRFIWHLLDHCGVFRSVWRSSAEIHYLAGIQDVGHKILAMVNDADDEALIKMMKENKGDINV